MARNKARVDDQVVVITGASSGIGLATALALGSCGASVVLVARNKSTLIEAQRRIEDEGGHALVASADVADQAALEDVANAAVRCFGRIDAWVNDAGVTIYGRLGEVEDADNRRLFETNFWGTVYGSLVALPYLRRQGGTLVNLGSLASDAVIPLQGMYTASKHAIKGFTDALRIEVEHLDHAPVEIVLIQPTAVNTPIVEHARNYLDHKPELPAPVIEPEEVAAAILRTLEEGGRDVAVGESARLGIAGARFLPRLGDRAAAVQGLRQVEAGPPRNPEGALHGAGGEGSVHARF